MRATAWHSGGEPTSASGYGIKFNAADRDRYFERDWTSVALELEGGPTIAVSLTDSFWRACSEMRSAEIGRWLLKNGHAPWSTGRPPGIVVTLVVGNHFVARVLRQHKLL